METTNANKPAYPTNARMHSDAMGLTKRELFALAAMQGICANNTADIPAHGPAIAQIAVECADALLEQLNKTSE